MRIQKLICNHENAPLVLVFLGYAFTPDCLKNFDFQNCDVAVVYDYQNFEFENPELFEEIKNSNREKILIAWSMGVWVANQFASEIKFQKAVAINGTPFGIHDSFGISKETFKNSIDNFDFEMFKKWCFLGDAAKTNFKFSENPKAELQNFYDHILENVENKIAWDKAIVSKKDVVFPPKASACFACPVQTILAPHFPFFKLKSLEEILAI